MLSWIVAPAQTTPSAPAPAAARHGLSPTAAAAWLDATDAAIAIFGDAPADTRPLVLQVDTRPSGEESEPLGDGYAGPAVDAEACSAIVVSPGHEAGDVPDLAATRAAIEDRVAAILGAATLSVALAGRSAS